VSLKFVYHLRGERAETSNSKPHYHKVAVPLLIPEFAAEAPRVLANFVIGALGHEPIEQCGIDVAAGQHCNCKLTLDVDLS
jgi:hypothetical protein